MPQPPLRTDSARSLQPKNGITSKTGDNGVYYVPLNDSDNDSPCRDRSATKRLSVTSRRPTSTGLRRKQSGYIPPRICYAINPDKSWKMELWDAIMLLLFTEVTLQTPYEMAFHKPKFGRVFWTNRFFDMIFLTDMIMRFFVSYPDLVSNRMVSDFQLIAKKYLTGWFTIDALSLFPWDWFALWKQSLDPIGNSAYFNPWRILRLLRILRVIRATHGRRIMSRLQLSIGVQYTLIAIFQNVLLMLVGCHWSACLWGWVAMKEKYSEGELSERTWLSVVSENKGGPEGFYTEASEIYWVALYWAVMTMTGVGYGDVVPQNHFEYKIAVVTMVLVSLVWAFVVGNIVTVLATLNPHETHYKQSMDDLNLLLSDWDVPHSLRIDLRRYFMQAKRLNHYLEQKMLLERVSPHLHAEVSIHLHESWINNVSFFRTLPLVELISIVRLLQAIMYSPHEEIPAHRSLFIVWRGICCRQGKVYLRHDVWGDDMILDNDILRSAVSSRAISFVELLMLEYGDLVEFCQRSPLLTQEIKRAKKFIALSKAMILIKRIWNELHHCGTINKDTLTQQQRLALAELVLSGRLTEDASSHPFQLERAITVVQKTKDLEDVSEGDEATDAITEDRKTSTKTMLTAFSTADQHQDELRANTSQNLKAMAQTILEELMSRAHADGMNATASDRSNALSLSPSHISRHASHATYASAHMGHVNIAHRGFQSGLGKIGSFGHSLGNSVSHTLHAVRGKSPFGGSHYRTS